MHEFPSQPNVSAAARDANHISTLIAQKPFDLQNLQTSLTKFYREANVPKVRDANNAAATMDDLYYQYLQLNVWSWAKPIASYLTTNAELKKLFDELLQFGFANNGDLSSLWDIIKTLLDAHDEGSVTNIFSLLFTKTPPNEAQVQYFNKFLKPYKRKIVVHGNRFYFNKIANTCEIL